MKQKEWINTSLREHKDNYRKDVVQVRINKKENKYEYLLKIGLDICELLNFKVGDRMNVFIHKNDDTKILIVKNEEGSRSLLHSKNYNYVSFRNNQPNNFRISQNVSVDYEFMDNNSIQIDITKVKN